MSKEKLYIVEMSSFGDGTLVSLVKEDKYQWLVAEMPKEAEEEKDEHGYYIDTTCPDRVRKEIGNYYGEEVIKDGYPRLEASRNEWQNEKANVIEGDIEGVLYTKDITDFIIENSDKYEIVGTFSGMVI